MCGAAEYHNNHGKLNIMDVVFNQPEESPFFLAEPRTSTERLITAHGRIRGASSTGLPDIAALIIRAPSKGCPAHGRRCTVAAGQRRGG